jgi:glutamate dehydrogenase (NAD(P)+)
VAVQGFGNVGHYAATLGQSLYGCHVVAVSDSRGGIFHREGLDVQEVAAHKEKTGSVAGYPKADSITNPELLELEVDILIPAALENVITRENAPQVRAKILAEMANGPVTPEADDILFEQGVHLVPDILCNGGGVIVSYLEMVQNFSMDQWAEADVNRRLEERMGAAYRAVQDLSSRYHNPLRKAAYTIAVRRVVEAMRLRGWI